MDTSFYQSIKPVIASFLGLSHDAIHIHLGLAALLLTILLLGKRRRTILYLLPVIAIAMIMEMFDLYDDYQILGSLRWSESFGDILNTIFWPVLIVVLIRINQKMTK